MKRRLLALCVGGVLALGIASPVAADTTFIAVAGTDHLVAVLDGGTVWASDGIEHARGWTADYHTVGGPYMTGASLVVANWNINASGNGTMWGTTDVTLVGGLGGWHETWVATWDAGTWAGWGVGHGWGSLDGMKVRLTVWATGFGTDAFEGFIFDPGN